MLADVCVDAVGKLTLVGMGSALPRTALNRTSDATVRESGTVSTVVPSQPCGSGSVPRRTSWSVDSGRVMARHWQDACVDAVAKLPPVWAPRFGERSDVELRSFVLVRSVPDDESRSQPSKPTHRLTMALPRERLRRSDCDTTHTDSLTRWHAQCRRRVIAAPAPLEEPRWRVTGGGVMARYCQHA